MSAFAPDAYVSIGADITQFSTKLKKVRSDAAQFAQGMTSIGAKLTGLAAAGAGGIGIAAKQFADLDAELRAIQGIAGVTEQQMLGLTATIRKLGSSTSFTALEVADAAKNLARAGLSATEVAEALRDTLTLSRASGVGIADASAIASRALRQFAIEADNTGRVVDVLAKAANSGAFDLIDLGETLKFIGPIARGVGQSIEEVTAVSAVLANQGLRGGIAGRQYKRLLIELANVEKQAKLSAAGVTDIFDGLGRLQSPSRIFEQLNASLGKLTDRDRLAFLDDIFGEAAPVAQALTDNYEQLIEKTRQLEQESAGYAKTNSDLIDRGLLGQFKILISAVTDLGIEVGRVFQGQLTLAANTLVELVNALKSWITDNEDLVQSLLPIVAGVGALGAAFLAIGGAAAIFSALVGAVATASTVIGGFIAGTLVSGPVVGFVAALAALVSVASAISAAFGGPNLVVDAFKTLVEGAGAAVVEFLQLVAELAGFDLADLTPNNSGDAIPRATAELEKLQQTFDRFRREGKFAGKEEFDAFVESIKKFEKESDIGLDLTFNYDTGEVVGDLNAALDKIEQRRSRLALETKIAETKEAKKNADARFKQAFRNSKGLSSRERFAAIDKAGRESRAAGKLLPALERALAQLPAAQETGGGLSGSEAEKKERSDRVVRDRFDKFSAGTDIGALFDFAGINPLAGGQQGPQPPDATSENALREQQDAILEQARREEEARKEQQRQASDQAKTLADRVADFGLESDGVFGARGLSQRIASKTLSLQELLVDETKSQTELLKAIEKAILNNTLVVG